MAYRLDIGAKINGTLQADSGRVLTDGRGVAHAVMSAVVNSTVPDRRFGEIGAVDYVRIGFPIGPTSSKPFAETHFSAKVSGSLNRKQPPYKFNSRTILTIDDMKTHCIGEDHYSNEPVEDEPRSFMSWFLGTPEGRRETRWRFVAPSAVDVLARWKEEGYSTLSRNPDGIKLRLTADSFLQFHDKGTKFDGLVDDIHLAARIAVEYLRDRSDGVITIGEGTEDYRMSLWAHAQLLRLVVSDYQPPQGRQEAALRLVEELRARYAAEKVALRPFHPKSTIRTWGQRFYANHRPRILTKII